MAAEKEDFGGVNTEDDSSLLLSWSNQSSSFGTCLVDLRNQEDFCDVTLVAGEQNFPAHRVVLSACSEYIRGLLKPLPKWQHPVLLLPSHLPHQDVEDILEFVYAGKVQVERTRLESFLMSADLLKIRGLSEIQRPKKDASNSKRPLKDNNSTLKVDSRKSSVEKRHKSPIEDDENQEDFCNSSKRMRIRKPVTATITPVITAKTKTSSPTTVTIKNESLLEEEEIAEKEEEERLVIHSDPGLMAAGNFGDGGSPQPNNDPIAAGPTVGSSSHHESHAEEDNRPLVVLFSESARCHFCTVLCQDRTSLIQHLEEAHQPPRHALCENCENFFHICAIQRHKTKCIARYQSEANQN